MSFKICNPVLWHSQTSVLSFRAADCLPIPPMIKWAARSVLDAWSSSPWVIRHAVPFLAKRWQLPYHSPTKKCLITTCVLKTFLSITSLRHFDFLPCTLLCPGGHVSTPLRFDDTTVHVRIFTQCALYTVRLHKWAHPTGQTTCYSPTTYVRLFDTSVHVRNTRIYLENRVICLSREMTCL